MSLLTRLKNLWVLSELTIPRRKERQQFVIDAFNRNQAKIVEDSPLDKIEL